MDPVIIHGSVITNLTITVLIPWGTPVLTIHMAALVTFTVVTIAHGRGGSLPDGQDEEKAGEKDRHLSGVRWWCWNDGMASL